MALAKINHHLYRLTRQDASSRYFRLEKTSPKNGHSVQTGIILWYNPSPTMKLLIPPSAPRQPINPFEHRQTFAAPVVAAPKPSSGAISAGWILLLAGCAIAFIPMAGFVVYLIGIPLCIAAFILGILGAAKGKTAAGVLLILASLTIGPLAMAAAPWISVGIAAHAAERAK